MNQRELAKKIGVHERTIRKWSPAKRKQWETIVNHPYMGNYGATFFDLYAQLAFRVAALNGKQGEYTAGCDMGIGGGNFYLHRTNSKEGLECFHSARLNNANGIAAALTELEKYA